MNEQVLSLIADELARLLIGSTLAKVVQLAPARFALDLRAPDNRLLFIAAEPARARLYLIRRSLRSLEREQLPLNHFSLLLRRHAGGARLTGVTKDAHDRVLRFIFEGHTDAGGYLIRTLIAQLTGRSVNLFLLDEEARIIERLRQTHGPGQEIGERYVPPPNASRESANALSPQGNELLALFIDTRRSPSEILDEYDQARDRAARFLQRATAELARLRREIQKREKLRHNLQSDMRAHGNPEAHKRAGDLLLANLATAERDGSRVRLTDYFADDAPTIELETDENKTLQEAAADLFTRYAKAKRARAELTARLSVVETEITDIAPRVAELERIIADEDEAALDALLGTSGKDTSRRAAPRKGAKPNVPSDHVPGTRRYRSTDGFEIIVGRGARENDQLTFRVALPNDLWLHAADYPGAHVIVRNHTRAEIPHRTIIEAAQLAAHTSQAKEDSKVSVHYTPRKFISKPKGAAPGLVRLSNFRTLLVEPREAGERI
jgi:predicted ribosome quality control (RQC) complex YloA/Tae2 family protein